MSLALRAALASATVLCGTASASEVEQVSVVRAGARYDVAMRVRLSVPADKAFATFTRYRDLPRINPSVQTARVIGQRGDITRVDTTLHICILFFCRRMRMTQDMRPLASDGGLALAAIVVPQMSDFRYGDATWRFISCPPGACVSFRAELEPDFWIPPLIGTWLMKRELRNQAVATSEGIERLAHEAP